MKIAVVGSGIAGISAAWALRKTHQVTLFEAAERLGGHSNTVDINYDGRAMSVDTGFIVYNTLNYPNLTALFDHLDIKTQRADMSFAFSAGKGREWSSNGLGGVFAWRRNLARIEFLSMLTDICRFSLRVRADLDRNKIHATAPLGEYLAGCRLGEAFLSNYLLPMGAAIWSTPAAKLLDFPAHSFLRFFNNHRLLQLSRPKWRSVTGGSTNYVHRIAHDLEGMIELNTPVLGVVQTRSGVEVDTPNGSKHFDAIIMACHSDQSLCALKNPTDEQRNILSAVKYGKNTAYLHRDTKLMPQRRAAWGAWNYLSQENSEKAAVTYWMNPLQNLPAELPIFVTLNPSTAPSEEKIFKKIHYDHPLFDQAALLAQRKIHSIQGEGGVWFAGAWLGYGFHEDGLASGLQVAHKLGAKIPWRPNFTRLEQFAMQHDKINLSKAA